MLQTPVILRAFAVLFFIVIHTQVFSQLQKGNFVVGADFSYSHSKRTEPNNLKGSFFNLKVSPQISYLITSRLTFGVVSSLTIDQSNHFDGGRIFRNTAYGAGPVARYYFPLKRWVFFGETKLLFEHIRFHHEEHGSIGGDVVETMPGKRITAAIGVGTGYFIVPNVLLESTLSYYSTNTEYGELKGKSHENGLAVNCGVRVFLKALGR